jgi:hypothetical protein
LFDILARSEEPKTAADLAREPGGEELFIGERNQICIVLVRRLIRKLSAVRHLRGLNALGFVKEVDEQTWVATPVTKAMAMKPMQAAHIHQHVPNT